MDKSKLFSNIISTKVYMPSGEEAGFIEGLIIDPSSGIVRFTYINLENNRSILMPWAAMFYIKSKGAFKLTHRGEHIIKADEHSN